MIWQSKEFLTVIVDLVVSTALYFGAKYLGEGEFEDLQWVIVALQPVVALLIAHFAVERVKAELRHMLKVLNK